MAFAEGKGVAEVHVLAEEGSEAPTTLRFSERFECQSCDITYRPPDPRLFSFNNPYGACPTCQGFGNTMNLDRDLVIPDPKRSLREGPIEPFLKTRYRKFQRKMLEWAEREAIDLDTPFDRLPERIREMIWHGTKGFPGVKGFFGRLSRKKYKMHVRIFIARYRGYARCPDCGGERLRREARDVYINGLRISQLTQLTIHRIREFFSTLQLGTEKATIARKLLVEIEKRLEFLEEVGLSYLTLDRLTSTLSGGEMQRIHLAASLGSSLAGALYVLDEPSIGLHPRDQSRLVALLKRPLTGRYLRGESRIPTPTFRRQPSARKLRLRGVQHNNLKNLDIDIPLGLFVCITGVSGSGKSTLVQDVLYAGLMKQRGQWKGATGRVRAIEGGENLSEVVLIDQSPIGRTPRSNPVTYIKAFDEIRKTFASLREAQARNLTPAHFSFNGPGGRCETCQGSGVISVDMQFLADVELECEDCGGMRYQKKVLEVTYKGKNIHDVLNMTVREAILFFSSHRSLVRRLRLLQEVGLDYVRLGQSATTLSGGEAQRIKIAAYLSRKTKGRPLFILDEPTTGLHFEDINKLLRAFDRLQSGGASILVIEHNLDVIKGADWVIDLGPEGGEDGGRIVVQGTPEQIAACPESHTGRFLVPYLEQPAQSRTAESA
ncbi:MAG: excinuclease ABC subunit UvrA [Acidobacteriota bacterium]